ncbi:MAG: hypothetical protein ABMA25_18530, partial [Ilumatobacteraceae bacterium]
KIVTRLTAAAVGIVAAVSLASPALAAGSSGGGTGSLVAHGRGTAQIVGDVDAMGISGRGVLVVIDRGGDATVTITGKGVAKVAGNTRTYAGFDGKAKITGSNVTVRLVGTNVDLAARGDGSFSLKGIGTYDTKPNAAGGEGTWKATGTTGEL